MVVVILATSLLVVHPSARIGRADHPGDPMKRLTVNFNTCLHAFFQAATELDDMQLLEIIERASSGKEPLIRHPATWKLPDFEEKTFATQWAKVKQFIAHCQSRDYDWAPQQIIYQMKLVASGERGVKVHDNAIMLPLDD